MLWVAYCRYPAYGLSWPCGLSSLTSASQFSGITSKWTFSGPSERWRITRFNAPAAVIFFFVISGFCIHFPNRNGVVMRSWKLYYARRYLRTLIPMMAALGLALPL